MATAYFTVKHTNAKTVFFRFYRPDLDQLYDFDTDTWEDSPTTPKLAATEKTSVGDADESLYVASYNLQTMYNGYASVDIVRQAVDDLATDEVIEELTITVANGRIETADSTVTTSKLNAVNELLEAVNEYPVTALDTNGTSMAADAERYLDRMSRRIQERGWYENTEKDVTTSPDDDGLINF